MSTSTALQKFVDKEAIERQEMSRQEELALELLKDVENTSFEIESDEDFELASDMLIEVKENIKSIEKRRKKVTQPMYQALEAFREMYRPTLRAYERAEKLLKKWTGEYALKKKQAEEEAMRQISQAEDFETALAISEKVETVPIRTGLSFSEEWSYELVDLSQVPEEYLMLNDRAVKNYIKSYKKEKPKDVPGLRFFRKSKVQKTREKKK